MNDFSDFFCKATGFKPYQYQAKLAKLDILPTILSIPTGCGKTEAVVLTWLWHRKFSKKKERTPRRLVYCLPMRAIVDQTVNRVNTWMNRLRIKDLETWLGTLSDQQKNTWKEILRTKDSVNVLDKVDVIQDDVNVVVLMGGSVEKDWATEPEKDTIIIGTQDMLLSRALNRGYGISPYRWPIEFGLVNNDCMWIIDEVQLMNSGLPTSLQLQAFRNIIGTYDPPSHTIWMSATINEKELETVDFHDHDMFEEKNPNTKITKAKKQLKSIDITPDKDSYKSNDVKKILGLHKNKPTTIIANKVKRAQALFRKIKEEDPNIEVLLIHSRFRPHERSKLNEKLENIKKDDNIIIISTQAIEAGVDISSHTLITELAPITSMIQRFGRCNRHGEYDDAYVYWIEPDMEKDSSPYTEEELKESKLWISKHKSVSPEDIAHTSKNKIHQTMLRRADLIGLFDTTPDMSGGYLDVSRFVRSAEMETDVTAYWRDMEKDTEPTKDMSKHHHGELCKIPIGSFKKFAKSKTVWYYDHMNEEYYDNPWVKAHDEDILPGRVFLLSTNDGGYSEMYGWNEDETSNVNAVPPCKKQKDDTSNKYNNDVWVSLSKHSKETRDEANNILSQIKCISDGIKNMIKEAALYHDLGKSHHVFQETLTGNDDSCKNKDTWAKSPNRGRTHSRKNFRHEVGSALAYLKHHESGEKTDLVAYLIAAHHGKVRMTMRSMLNRKSNNTDHDHLLGFSTDPGRPDSLPKISLDNKTIANTKIDMTLAKVGESKDGCRSWLNRTTALRDDEKLGIFRIAYLEAVLRAADVRASKG